MRVIKFIYHALVKIIAGLRASGFWGFPNGIRVSFPRVKLIQQLATDVAGELAREAKSKRYSSDSNELMKDPFLRFHANYSLTHVDMNTPCTKYLAVDLASVINLANKKILCLGARNLDEIFQLQLVGAQPENITAIDLYSDFPEIIAMDFQDLKFVDHSFDVIFWAGSYAYASDPMRALSEAFRVLRRPGVFALGDTYIGNADKTSYNSNQKHWMLENPELNLALDEMPPGTLLTKSVSGIEEVQDRIKSFGVEKIVLSRDYVGTPHYNLIAAVS